MTIKEYNDIVDKWADNVYRFVLSNTKDDDNAKDIVQDAFEKLWIKKDSVDYTKAKSYLFTTAYHSFIDFTRKNKRVVGLSEAEYHQPKVYSQYSDVNEVLHQAINQLPEAQKAVILLRDYEGYNYEEIAEITNLSLAQVKVYIFRGRSHLKKVIGSIEALV